MKNAQQEQDARLAALAETASMQPGSGDPRFQRNNPLAFLGYEPGLASYRTPYNDQVVTRPTTGMTLTPSPQQRVIARPSKAGAIPGHPAFMLDPQMERELQGFNGTARPALMAASQQRPPGDPQAGIKRGIGVPAQQRGTDMTLSGLRRMRGASAA